MQDADVRDQVARLEARLEALSESVERCRKISVGSKIAVALGMAWFVLMLFSILPFDATFFVGALTAVLGGVVLLGSNQTTWEQTEAELHKAEAMRAALIGTID
ncbi:MAG: hypothetical protein ABI830_14660, partial [Pseudolabrys sp.]